MKKIIRNKKHIAKVVPSNLTCTEIGACAHAVNTISFTNRNCASIRIINYWFIFPSFRTMNITLVVTGIPAAVALMNE